MSTEIPNKESWFHVFMLLALTLFWNTAGGKNGKADTKKVALNNKASNVHLKNSQPGPLVQ